MSPNDSTPSTDCTQQHFLIFLLLFICCCCLSSWHCLSFYVPSPKEKKKILKTLLTHSLCWMTWLWNFLIRSVFCPLWATGPINCPSTTIRDFPQQQVLCPVTKRRLYKPQPSTAILQAIYYRKSEVPSILRTRNQNATFLKWGWVFFTLKAGLSLYLGCWLSDPTNLRSKPGILFTVTWTTLSLTETLSESDRLYSEKYYKLQPEKSTRALGKQQKNPYKALSEWYKPAHSHCWTASSLISACMVFVGSAGRYPLQLTWSDFNL